MRRWIRPSSSFTTLAIVASIASSQLLVGCGSTGQKRQTKVASEVVDSAVKYRSGSAFAASSPSLAMVGVLEKPAVDVTPVSLQVGSMNAFVHEYADATTKVVGQLRRGDAVRKTGEADFIVPPISAKMDDLDGKGNPAMLATWSYVECADGIKGWVPTRALVTPEFFATSSEERLRELKRNRAGESGKGMVEKTKAKLFVGKGFGSEQDLQDPNPAKAKEIVATAAASPARFDLLGADYFAPVSSAAAPKAGVALAQLDPAAEARAAQVRADLAGMENGKPTGGVSDLLAIAGVQDDNAKAAAKIAEVIAILQKPRAPTPLEESGLGELAVAVVIGRAQVLPPEDPVSAYVSNVGLRVAAKCSNPYPATGYRFTVVDYPAANAIATPGGVILVSTGMLRFLQSEDELACILGHEIAHVEERQAMLSEDVDDFAVLSDLSLMGPDLLAEIVDDVLKDGGLPPAVVGMVKDGVSSQVASTLSEGLQNMGTEMWQNAANPGQSDECAADIRGIALASAAGYDMNAMDGVLARLSQIIGSYGGANYSESRPTDVSTVRAALPAVGASADAARADRWTKLQELLGRDA
jgi:hypothetical protein